MSGSQIQANEEHAFAILGAWVRDVCLAIEQVNAAAIPMYRALSVQARRAGCFLTPRPIDTRPATKKIRKLIRAQRQPAVR